MFFQKTVFPKMLMIWFYSLLISSAFFSCDNENVREVLLTRQDSLLVYCDSFHLLNQQIRDTVIQKKEAQVRFQRYIQMLRKLSKNVQFEKTQGWYFPVARYSAAHIGGKNGNGYRAKGYDYFDGNRHGAHPAHDIFVYDRNQDCIDDRTDLPIAIVSASHGIVVSAEYEWLTDSQRRGGKYIWVYDVSQEALFYYAHNQEVYVKIGDLVQAGQKIASMGRTGLNAYKSRSPTHLHFMCLKIEQNLPVPFNPYQKLLKAKVSD